MSAEVSIPKHGVTSVSLPQNYVDKIMDYITDRKPQVAQVRKKKKAVTDTTIRDADVYLVDLEQKDLYKILHEVANNINGYFKYDITGVEKAQIIHYKAPSNGYEYHIDLGSDNSAAARKISLSILLNDDYEGGEICFRTSEESSCTRPKAGDAVAFSSFIPHKINPITKGSRFVLVAWFTGPYFR